jgi:lipopolysaccharide export LptBFGC system permease protein LptF
MSDPQQTEAKVQKNAQMSADQEPAGSLDLTKAYDRAAHHLVPRAFFPFLAVFFVLLCGAMAVLLFGAGKILGGLLFSIVVAVGLYVAWNNFVSWRERKSH